MNKIKFILGLIKVITLINFLFIFTIIVSIINLNKGKSYIKDFFNSLITKLH